MASVGRDEDLDCWRQQTILVKLLRIKNILLKESIENINCKVKIKIKNIFDYSLLLLGK